MEPFARTIDAAKTYVVSSTLDRVDWNAELRARGSGGSRRRLKQESGKGLYVAGVKLPLALTELGLSRHVDLKLVSRLEYGSGAVAMRYEPRR